MNDPIPEPLRGADVISWAHPVTRVLNALHDKIGAPTRNERDRRPTRQPQPFEVRWDSSLDGGNGGWKIYLPTEHLLTYGGVDVATSDISGATVIQDDNNDDTPWFSLDDIDTSADHIWLVVTITESNGSIASVDAEFAAEEGQAATGERVHNVCVAEVSYSEPEEEGLPAIVEISQSLVGALHLGGAGIGGGGGGGDDEDLSCWRIIEASGVHGFGNQFYCRGTIIVDVSLANTVESFVSQNLYYVALRVPAYAGGGGGETLQGYATLADVRQAQRDPAYTTRLLYQFDEQGNVVVDFRNCPTLQHAEAF